MPPSIRFINLTRDLQEMNRVSQLLYEQKRSSPIYISVIPLSAYRQKHQQTALGYFEWDRIHQGPCTVMRSYATCYATRTILFFDDNENIFHEIKEDEILLRRKHHFEINQEKKMGFLEIISGKQRTLLSFTLSQWPSSAGI
jgi:hypothetical protein